MTNKYFEEEDESEEIKDLEKEKVKEKENIGCEQLEKCELCNEESVNQNLCKV
jgi:ABC-type proline/glycine betaine transport system substrate-binding protein